MSGSRPFLLRVALVLACPLLLACAVRPHEFGESATDTSTSTTDETTSGAMTTLPVTGVSTVPDPTTGPASTSGPALTTGTDATTADDTGNPFLIEPDGGPEGVDCDPWIQDCPPGQKCMPYSGDGDNSWESLKCVEIVPNPAGLYEPCTAGPISTGEDTCDEGLMCWDTDPDTGVGHCVGLCIGSPDVPGCADPGASCILNSGPLALCLPACDPLLQDCPGDDLCIPNPGDPDAWICVLDASGDEGQAFDLCEYLNACDQGLLCLDPTVAAECDPMAIGCCIPLCDTTLPNTCPGEGQECIPWYEEGQAPFGLEFVGFCGLPMP